jgi:protein-L-isoaspartate(D-aspartate) O-methyltransferase
VRTSQSRYLVESGISGGGLWSPDYEAVIGIVGEANDRGDGHAVALYHVDEFLRTRDSASAAVGQRETTVLLFSAMLRAAGLDWFEQGDVWGKVAALRPDARGHHIDSSEAGRLGQAVRRLMATNTHRVTEVASEAVPETWWAAFDTAGHQLADLARDGHLERGVRAVLAHHFIFHANRAALPGLDQATLAALAVGVVFHADSPSTPSRRASAGTTSSTVRVSR